MPRSPRVALLLGDAAGIGPEIAARLLAADALGRAVATVVIGAPRLLARPEALAEAHRTAARLSGAHDRT